MLTISPSFLDGKSHPLSFLIDGPSTPRFAPLSSQKINSTIALLIITAVVFRAEVALLLGPLALQLLLTNLISFVSLIK